MPSLHRVTRLAFLMMPVIAAAVVASPVPPEDEAARLKRLYGTPVDQDKKATLTLVGSKLRVRLSDKPHGWGRLFSDRTPRIMREVVGDFVARVTLSYFPLEKVPDQNSGAYVGGGIVAVVGAGHYVHVEQSHQPELGESRRAVWRGNLGVQIYRPAPPSERHDFGWGMAAGKPVFLSLTRRKDTFTAEYSGDGKKWTMLKSIDVTAPEKLQVGLFTWHNTDKECEILFEDYSVGTRKE
jgi:hypothetical protein